MKPDGKYKRRITVLLGFILSVLVLATVVLTRDDSILGRATPVARVKDWAIPEYLNSYPTQSTAESSKSGRHLILA